MISEKEFTRRLMATHKDLQRYAQALTRSEQDAEDLVHSTIVKALQKQRSYDPMRSMRTWVTAIMRNHYYDECRVFKKYSVTSYEPERHTVSTPCSQEQHIMLMEALENLQKLSRPVIEVLLMSGLQGLSHEQISEQTGLALGTVKCRIRRGKKALEHHRADYAES